MWNLNAVGMKLVQLVDSLYGNRKQLMGTVHLRLHVANTILRNGTTAPIPQMKKAHHQVGEQRHPSYAVVRGFLVADRGLNLIRCVPAAAQRAKELHWLC